MAELDLTKAKEIIDYLGIDDLDKFKETIASKFLLKDTAHENEDVRKKVTGDRMQKITSKFLPIAKMIDPDTSHRKISEKNFEDYLDEFAGAFSTKLTSLEEAGRSGNDKKVNELEAMLLDTKKSVTAYKEVADKVTGEFETYKSDASNQFKDYKINHQLGIIKSKIAFVDDITEIQRIGYDTALKNNFKFDLDDKENLIVMDKEGKPVQREDKAAIADPLYILGILAEKNNLMKKNNANQNNLLPLKQNKINTEQKNGMTLSASYLKKIALRG